MLEGVVKFVPQKLVRNEAAIKILRDALEVAERGEIVEVVVAGVMNDGASWTASSGTGHVQAQLGSLEIIKHRIISGME